MKRSVDLIYSYEISFLQWGQLLSSFTLNLSLLHQFFSFADVEIINGIPIPNIPHPDSLWWDFTKLGRYTIISGNLTAQQYVDENLISSYGPDVRVLLAKVLED